MFGRGAVYGGRDVWGKKGGFSAMASTTAQSAALLCPLSVQCSQTHQRSAWHFPVAAGQDAGVLHPRESPSAVGLLRS